MQYYSSETCGYNGSDWVQTGCTSDYTQSEIKYVVDAWALDKFQSSDLKEDSLGYKARLITFDELTTNLGYDKNAGGCIPPSTNGDNTPDWVYNNAYEYWTMTPFHDLTWRAWYVSHGYLYASTTSIYEDCRGVRPVVTILKSSLS